MFTKKLALWIRAIRPFSLSGSVIPVTLGAVLALSNGKFSILYFFMSVIAIVLLHSGVNLLSDRDDFEKKVDTKDSYGSSGVIIENLLQPGQVARMGKYLLILGILLGLIITYKRGWTILLIGAIGAFVGYSYTGKPFAFKYKGLGDILVFLIFGPLMTIGSYYVQMQTITFSALWVSIPIGLLTTAILYANNVRDIIHDKKADIKTLPMMIGREKAKNIYYLLIILSYLLVLIMAVYRQIPYWSLVCFITLPSAFKNIMKLYYSENDSSIVTLDKETAQLQGQFGILLILSILITSIFR